MIIGNSSQFASISFRKKPLQQTVTNRLCISDDDKYSWINLWLISSTRLVGNQPGIRSRLVEVFVNIYKRLAEHVQNYVTFRATGSSFVSLFLCSTAFDSLF